MKNNTLPDLSSGTTPNDLYSNNSRSSSTVGLVERLNGLFQRADESGDVVTPQHLAAILSDPEPEVVAPAISGLDGPPVRLMRAAEGLSEESLELLFHAVTHLLRSELSDESDQLLFGDPELVS